MKYFFNVFIGFVAFFSAGVLFLLSVSYSVFAVSSILTDFYVRVCPLVTGGSISLLATVTERRRLSGLNSRRLVFSLFQRLEVGIAALRVFLLKPLSLVRRRPSSPCVFTRASLCLCVPQSLLVVGTTVVLNYQPPALCVSKYNHLLRFWG